MDASIPNSEYGYTPLSEEEKKEFGVDVRSFMNRMKKRLDKVRGTEGDKNTFLMRHNYEAYARAKV